MNNPTPIMLNEAISRLNAVDALHRPYDDGFTNQWCAEDAHPWPCPTHLILHPENDQP